MVKKFKILICSTTFLTCSVFSAQAMSSDDFEDFEEEAISSPLVTPAIIDDPQEKARVYEFCRRYKFQAAFTEEVYNAVRGKANELNQYGVPNLDYKATILLYSRLRSPYHMGLLFDLFAKTPLEHRETIWNYLVQWERYQSTGPSLYNFYYNSANERVSDSKSSHEDKTLKQTLFDLPAPETRPEE